MASSEGFLNPAFSDSNNNRKRPQNEGLSITFRALFIYYWSFVYICLFHVACFNVLQRASYTIASTYINALEQVEAKVAKSIFISHLHPNLCVLDRAIDAFRASDFNSRVFAYRSRDQFASRKIIWRLSFPSCQTIPSVCCRAQCRVPRRNVVTVATPLRRGCWLANPKLTPHWIFGLTQPFEGPKLRAAATRRFG